MKENVSGCFFSEHSVYASCRYQLVVFSRKHYTTAFVLVQV